MSVSAMRRMLISWMPRSESMRRPLKVGRDQSFQADRACSDSSRKFPDAARERRMPSVSGTSSSISEFSSLIFSLLAKLKIPETNNHLKNFKAGIL